MKSRQDFITDAEWWEYYRQYTAAMAMQGLLANPEWMVIYEGQKYLMQSDLRSKVSVEAADALINALNKQDETK